MSVSTQHEFTHGIVELYDEGYVQHTVLRSLTESDAEESMDAILSFEPPEGTFYILVDMKYQGMWARHTRKVFQRRMPQNAVIAFVSRSKVTEAIINFVLTFSKSEHTSRIFSNDHDALSWLKDQGLHNRVYDINTRSSEHDCEA